MSLLDAVAAGIVLGDLVFVALALLGITALAEWAGSLFTVLRTLGGMYLVWLGVGLLRSRGGTPINPEDRVTGARDLAASFLAGFTLTLGDVKAILFYASLFPAFVDMSTPGGVDVVLVVLVTVVAVGGVKLSYAAGAARIAGRLERVQARGRSLRILAGMLVVAAGLYVIASM
jgi:threonine/homoserine/homoserine lactone efflux protein